MGSRLSCCLEGGGGVMSAQSLCSPSGRVDQSRSAMDTREGISYFLETPQFVRCAVLFQKAARSTLAPS